MAGEPVHAHWALWLLPHAAGREVVIDLGVTTHVCVCNGELWKVLVTFEDYEVATYSTEMYCDGCGAKALAPTLLDKPNDFNSLL